MPAQCLKEPKPVRTLKTVTRMTQPDNPASIDTRARTVVCPTCGGDSVYSPVNASRPFCSERCKQVDFGAWASENFRMPAEAPPADAQYGDPRTQSH